MITNTASATADEFDPAQANNAASAATEVGRHLYLPLIARAVNSP